MTDLLKRKHKTRAIHQNYIILNKIDRGSSCARVAKNYNIPKQTLSY